MADPDLSTRTQELMAALAGARAGNTATERHEFVETIMMFAVTDTSKTLRVRAQDYLFTAYGLTVDADAPATAHTQVAP